MGRATGTHISGKEDNQMYGKQVFRIIIVFLAIMALTLILGSSAGAADYKTLQSSSRQTSADPLPMLA
jgi:hypothetical protein